MLRKYEIIVLLNDRKVDDGGESLMADVAEFTKTLGGEITSSKSLGRKQFAHPIRKRNSGVYWVLVGNLPADGVVALKDHYRLNQIILRLEVFNYDHPEQAPAEPEPEPAAAES